MIEPWQVWPAQFSFTGGRDLPDDAFITPVVVVSSELHLELTGGRMVTVVPLTYVDRGLRHHVKVKDDQGNDVFVMTDQVRTMNSLRFTSNEPSWTMHADEWAEVRRALQHMAAF